MKIVDMTGQRYGHLTVIEMLPKCKEKKTCCRCRCVCGKEVIKEAYALRHSKTASCGCMTGYHRSVWQRSDETGRTFHYLTIVEIKREHGKRPIAVCRCRCGNMISADKSDVVTGHTKSCGCLQRQCAADAAEKDFTGMKSTSGVELLSRAYRNRRGVWMWNCRCPLCGGKFVALPAKIMSNHTTSCGCRIMSSRERMIKRILDEMGVDYAEQKRFPDCKNKYTLPFDFAVFNSDKSINCLIEYDGKQHFLSIPMYGGDEALRQTHERDAIKNEYCKKHNIPLLRLNDSDKESDMREKITNTIYP